jgi:hypothetical protein
MFSYIKHTYSMMCTIVQFFIHQCDCADHRVHILDVFIDIYPLHTYPTLSLPNAIYRLLSHSPLPPPPKGDGKEKVFSFLTAAAFSMTRYLALPIVSITVPITTSVTCRSFIKKTNKKLLGGDADMKKVQNNFFTSLLQS